MKNNYLIECNDSLSLKNKIQEIIKTSGFSDISKTYYDIDEVELSSALEDLDTYGLFSTKKIIIIENIENLNIDQNQKAIDHLIKYLSNPNSENLLFITAKKLNNTRKLTKDLKKYMEYISVSYNAVDFTKRELKDFKLENGVIKRIVTDCLEDITKIHNECQKLITYKYDEKEITLEDVLLLVNKKLGDVSEMTFDFVRSLAAKDKKSSLKKYQELLNYEIEPLSLIGLMASQFRIIYQVKILQKENLSNDEIAKILGEKSSYRISKTKELTPYYSEHELLEILRKLADIDVQIKSSDVDGKFLIELFILNIIK